MLLPSDPATIPASNRLPFHRYGFSSLKRATYPRRVEFTTSDASGASFSASLIDIRYWITGDITNAFRQETFCNERQSLLYDINYEIYGTALDE